LSQPEKTLSSCFELPASLEWLIKPIRTETFFNEYWEKQPLVVRRAQSEYFAPLLSLDDVDRVITTLNLTYPNITIKNAEKEVTVGEYTTTSGALDVAAIYQLFNAGSTIVLAFLDGVLPPLAWLCRGLEGELNFPLQANVYLTPARGQGAKHHYDTHDVFVLQMIGSKRWTMYGTPVELPLGNQDFDPKIHDRGTPSMEFELEPGDLAYIPRGVMHDARSSEEVSLHITVGVLCYRWADLLLEFLAESSLRDPALRRGLPPGFAREESARRQAQQDFVSLLERLAKNSDCGPVLSRFGDQWISACPPLLRGQMDQIELLNKIRIASVVGTRSGVVFRIEKGVDSMTVHAFARKLIFPAYVDAALQFALNHHRFSVRDLQGNLDDNGKLVLVRRLVREGLLLILTV